MQRDRAFVQTGVKHLQFKPEDGTPPRERASPAAAEECDCSTSVAASPLRREGGGRRGKKKSAAYRARSSPRPCENVTLAPGPGC